MAYVKSSDYGGNGGGDFSDDLTKTCRMVSVSVRSGTYVDAITCEWVNIGGSAG